MHVSRGSFARAARGRRKVTAVAVAASLAAWGLGMDAGAAPPRVILTQVSQGAADQVSAGEAWVVADPTDARKLTVIWLGTKEPAAAITSPGTGYCGIGRSNDGGRTWSISKAPFESSARPSTIPICGDPAGGVLPDGTIVFTAVQLLYPEWVQAITSRDNGATWSEPTQAFGSAQWTGSMAASGSLQDMGWGRQFLTVDSITGDIYVQSQVDAPTTGRVMTTSSDAGATWSVPRNVGATTLGPISAAHGKVAGISTAGDDTVFQLSDDFGETWTRTTIPTGGPAERGYVAADPTTPGRFAVLLTTAADALTVWTTDDSGTTFTKTKVFTAETGDTLSRPWITFSPTGALGVVWRSHNADDSYDVDAVVSRDGGTDWAAPVRLTAGRGPSPSGFPLGDDCACNVQMTATTLSTTWGDRSTGARELWFGSFDYTKGGRK